MSKLCVLVPTDKTATVAPTAVVSIAGHTLALSVTTVVLAVSSWVFNWLN